MAPHDTIHKFEIAGLGKAPFKVVGFYKMPSPSLGEQNPDAYNNLLAAMPKGAGCGSCAYCGTPLINNYIIESADNNIHAVGCDCVEKVGDKGLTTRIKEMQRQARREAREIKRQAEWEAKMQAQRDANGGKTNAEIYQEKMDARNAIIDAGKETIVDDVQEILKALRYANGGFAHDMYDMLSECNFSSISSNMQRIILDIAAKGLTGARKGSKKYWAEYERLEPIMNKAREDHDALMANNPRPE